MYTVYIDGNILFDPRVEELKIYDPKLNLEVNTTFGFDFTIYPSHPLYSQISRFKTVVEVFQGSRRLFRGRVLNDERGLYNEKKVICEGDLAFFNDSVIRPYDYAGDIAGFLEFVIDEHNKQAEPEKQFELGEVTVSNSTNYITRSSVNPEIAWGCIEDKLLKLLGGFIMIRREDGVNYIDYVDDTNRRSLQEIELGRNLLDLTNRVKGEEINTALIPYGARLEDDEGNETDQRLTIESVNDGVDYVYDQNAVDRYGWVFGTQTWEDVTLPENLIQRAQQELARRMLLGVSIELTAIDLSNVDADIDKFRFFEYVKVNSPAHNLEDFMLVTKMEIDLINPENNVLTLGLDYDTFTDNQVKTDRDLESFKEETERKVDQVTNVVTETQRTFTNELENTAEEFRRTLTDEYVQTNNFELYREEVSTQFEQTAQGFQFDFNRIQEDISRLEDETTAEFTVIDRYIRFEDGSIILGEHGDPVRLIKKNDRISFERNGYEVMYITDNEVYVTDIEVISQLKIGRFGFIPRSNGSLDFKQIVSD